MVVLLSILVKIRIWIVDLGLDIRIVGVDLVESIHKGSISGLASMPNR